tara:strand:- start:3405 stop:3629 length:225 start_codon:yes stop_codon:yes gene_type:complete
MGLQRCSECGIKYQPLVGGATMNLCGDCISAGLNDGHYNEIGLEEEFLDKKEDEDTIPDDFIDESVPDESDDLV